MDPSIRTVGTFLNEDQRWLGNGGQPIGQPRDIILDRSLFDLADGGDFPNGFIPSGVTIAEVTATGLYGPYDDAAIDGREVMAGHLFASVPYDRSSTGDLSAALFWSGEVIEASLPATHGLDAAGKVEVANHISYV